MTSVPARLFAPDATIRATTMLPAQRLGCVNVHGLHVRAATDELAGFAAAPIQQDRQLSAETRMIERSLLSLQHVLQNGQPLRGAPLAVPAARQRRRACPGARCT